MPAVKEPTLIAVIGLAGVVVGAVGSGVVQALLARLDRNRDARAAARLLWMKLHSADAALRALQIEKAWLPANLDFAQYMAAWEQRSDALSRVLKSKAALDVDAAFSLMDAVAMAKAEDEATAKESGEPLGFGLAMDVLALYRREVEAAKAIVYYAAFTKLENRRGKIPPPGKLPPPDFVPPEGG
jgi:hypothetical protein